MEASEFYPEVLPRPSQPDLAERVAELERVVATLASLRRERSLADLADRPDPVAITAALHPGGMRSTRGAKRHTTNRGTIPVRFVLFDPTASR
jgi:hypothetical protein